MKMKKLRIAVITALAGVSGLTCQAAVAQQAQAAKSTGLEEITVTALRREQNLQEVPVSIVAITGEGLELRGIDNLEKVSMGVPNVVITGGGGGTGATNFRMRGIPNVGTYIDNVWQVSTAGFLTQEFVDIDRVEVLRGPQGTMFGRDSTGGAIRIWTKAPAAKQGGSVSATLGTYNRQDIKASVDLPIGDTLRTKFTVGTMSRDGYINSLTTGQAGGGIDQQVKRADIVWDPIEKLSIRANFQQDISTFTEPRVQDAMYRTYDDPNPLWTKHLVGFPEFYTLVGTDRNGKAVVPFFDPKHEVAGYPGGTVGKWENRSNSTLPNHYNTEQQSIEFKYQITADIQAKYQLGKVHQDANSVVDWDNSEYDIVTDINRSKLDMTSHEVQLTGKGDVFVKFDWLVGAYKWSQEARNRNSRWTGMEFVNGQFDVNKVLASAACNPVAGTPKGWVGCAAESASNLGPGSNYETFNQTGQDGTAYFGELTFHVTDKMDLIYGLRHHSQTGYSQGLAVIPGVTAPKPALPTQYHAGDVWSGNPTGIPTRFEFGKNTPRVVLEYRFTDLINAYASYSEGFNSGGVTAINVAGVRTEFPYKPSTLKNREIGFRSELLDRKLRLNVTMFNTIWADLQAAGVIYDPVTHAQLPQLATTNVGEANAKGFEVEATYAPADGWLINVGYGKLNTGYTKILPGTMSGQLPLDAGTEFAQAPSSSYSLGVQYTMNVLKGELVSRIDYNYQGSFWRSEPFLRTAAYDAVKKGGGGLDESGDWGVTNFRVTYRPTGADWEASLFGTNIANNYMINSGFFHGIWGYDFATVGRPAEYGVTMKYKF